MALIKCPECQEEISDQAAACPHCGYPIATRVDAEKVVRSAERQEPSSGASPSGTQAQSSADCETYPDSLNGYLYRVEKDRSVSALDPSGEEVRFPDWQTFWDAAGGGKGINVSPDPDSEPPVRLPKDKTPRNIVVVGFLVLLLIGWAWTGFMGPSALVNGIGAADECVKFAKEKDVFQKNDQIRAVNMRIRSASWVYDLLAHEPDKTELRSRVCVVNGDAISIPSILEQGFYR